MDRRGFIASCGAGIALQQAAAGAAVPDSGCAPAPPIARMHLGTGHPDDPGGRQAFAFAYGYIRGLLQSHETRLAG